VSAAVDTFVRVQVKPYDWGYALWFPDYGFYAGVPDGEQIKVHAIRALKAAHDKGRIKLPEGTYGLSFMKGWDG